VKEYTIENQTLNTWLIQITPEGRIEFNKEDFPNFTADDFAREFIRIVEGMIVR